jgi:hypothetical protein
MPTSALALSAICVLACRPVDDRSEVAAATETSSGESAGAESDASSGGGAPTSEGDAGPADAGEGTAPGDASGDDTAGAGSDPGFVPEQGFVVTGDFQHGGAITITSEDARFGSREHPTPWLFDTVSAQYLAGVDLEAYVGLADGDPITLPVRVPTDELTHAIAGRAARCPTRS